MDANAVPAHGRARMGIGSAPEERRLFGPDTVTENLRPPAEVLGLKRAEVARRLDAVHAFLPELAALGPRRAASLGGGQGKTLALGRAIPLDEPFQGLAPALALNYSAALARLGRELPDVTVLVTESSPDLLRALVGRPLGIERGEIREALPAPG